MVQLDLCEDKRFHEIIVLSNQFIQNLFTGNVSSRHERSTGFALLNATEKKFFNAWSMD